MCVSEAERCDYFSDCGDNSDEAGCDLPCEADVFFQCVEGGCVDLTWKCDGFEDCFDGSDERGCPSSTAKPSTGDLKPHSIRGSWVFYLIRD